MRWSILRLTFRRGHDWCRRNPLVKIVTKNLRCFSKFFGTYESVLILLIGIFIVSLTCFCTQRTRCRFEAWIGTERNILRLVWKRNEYVKQTNYLFVEKWSKQRKLRRNWELLKTSGIFWKNTCILLVYFSYSVIATRYEKPISFHRGEHFWPKSPK